jgi:hypothetical protein
MGNAYSNMLDIVEREFVRVQQLDDGAEAARGITFAQLKDVRLPDDYAVDTSHIAVLFCLDANRDGWFSYDDLVNFLQWAALSSGTASTAHGHAAADALQARCVLRRWKLCIEAARAKERGGPLEGSGGSDDDGAFDFSLADADDTIAADPTVFVDWFMLLLEKTHPTSVERVVFAAAGEGEADVTLGTPPAEAWAPDTTAPHRAAPVPNVADNSLEAVDPNDVTQPSYDDAGDRPHDEPYDDDDDDDDVNVDDIDGDEYISTDSSDDGRANFTGLGVDDLPPPPRPAVYFGPCVALAFDLLQVGAVYGLTFSGFVAMLRGEDGNAEDDDEMFLSSRRAVPPAPHAVVGDEHDDAGTEEGSGEDDDGRRVAGDGEGRGVEEAALRAFVAAFVASMWATLERLGLRALAGRASHEPAMQARREAAQGR